jgi:hypothetical protein
MAPSYTGSESVLRPASDMVHRGLYLAHHGTLQQISALSHALASWAPTLQADTRMLLWLRGEHDKGAMHGASSQPQPVKRMGPRGKGQSLSVTTGDNGSFWRPAGQCDQPQQWPCQPKKSFLPRTAWEQIQGFCCSLNYKDRQDHLTQLLILQVDKQKKVKATKRRGPQLGWNQHSWPPARAVPTQMPE